MIGLLLFFCLFLYQDSFSDWRFSSFLSISILGPSLFWGAVWHLPSPAFAFPHPPLYKECVEKRNISAFRGRRESPATRHTFRLSDQMLRPPSSCSSTPRGNGGGEQRESAGPLTQRAAASFDLETRLSRDRLPVPALGSPVSASNSKLAVSPCFCRLHFNMKILNAC